ncbi:MAG: molecular chaperone DnaJ [Deltaproteobacteria bacterium]|nr:molecular chaperone DnaJ [Deltaproteobacteria bacterium]
MRRRPRQISLKECYDILKLKKDADTADLKRAYRRRAFELHPDLNPGNPDASKDFQLLNEAYVALSAVLKHEDTVRASTQSSRAEQEEARARAARDEAAEENERQASAGAEKEARQNGSAESEKARQQAGAETSGAAGSSGPSGPSAGPTGPSGRAGAAGSAGAAAGANRANRQEQGQAKANGASAGQQGAQTGYSEHDVLRDLLTDPFARRVFEDIYSELNRQHQAETPPPRPEEPAPEQPKAKPAPEKRNVKLHQSNLAWGTPKWNKDHSKGVTGMVKGWLRRQIDEEQSLTLPSANLAPGKRIRLQIRQALSGELKTVEITLPPDFAVGKPIRLRGLGKRVGPWQGDLYLIITNE